MPRRAPRESFQWKMHRFVFWRVTKPGVHPPFSTIMWCTAPTGRRNRKPPDDSFDRYSSQLRELFNIINDVAFARIDVRLAKKLIELGGQAGDVGLPISSWRSSSAVRERLSVANFRSSSAVVGSGPSAGTLVSSTAKSLESLASGK
jgi:hypothetical protein